MDPSMARFHRVSSSLFTYIQTIVHLSDIHDAYGQGQYTMRYSPYTKAILDMKLACMTADDGNFLFNNQFNRAR